MDVDSDLTAAYRLTTSIDCSGNGNAAMVGQQNEFFSGDFDGGGNTITMSVETNLDYVGLFPRTDGANIHDLTIAGSMDGIWRVGGLMGYASDTVIDNVNVTATIIGVRFVGGLVGESLNSTISNSQSSGNVTSSDGVAGGFGGQIWGGTVTDSSASGNLTMTATNAYTAGGFVGEALCEAEFIGSSATGSVTFEGESLDAAGGFTGFDGCEGPGGIYRQSFATGNVDGSGNTGGFVGEIYYGLLDQTYATGDVSGANNVGGLIGLGHGTFNIYGFVLESFSTGTVSGNDSVGGIVGQSDGLVLENTYSRSAVSGSDNVGGLIGYAQNGDQDFSLRNSYSTGEVTSGGEFVGGLVADTDGNYAEQASFWDTQTSTKSSSALGTGKTTSEMKDIATFTSDLGEDNWLFGINWGLNETVNDGYPCLIWSSEDCTYASASDSDGISSEIEDAAPNGGDGNNDGTLDSEQDNVASFVSSVTSKYVTIAVPDTCQLTEVGVGTEENKASVDSTFSYPNGLVNFTADCGTPGVSISVEQYYFNAGSASDFVARKYTAYNNTYQTLDGAAVTDVTIGSTPAVKLVFSLTDGGQLDNDQLANGIIVDPAGLGVSGISGTLANTGVRTSELQYAIAFILIGCALTFSRRRRTIS